MQPLRIRSGSAMKIQTVFFYGMIYTLHKQLKIPYIKLSNTTTEPDVLCLCHIYFAIVFYIFCYFLGKIFISFTSFSHT